jgi:hypothetical protein
MSLRRYHLVVMILAAAVVGCGASSDGPAATSPAASNPAQPSAPISQLPQNAESPPQSFLDGYRAYQNHDLATADERLGYAAEHFPRLADYALYYRGLAQRDSGNLLTSAAKASQYPTPKSRCRMSIFACSARVMRPRRLPGPSREPPMPKSNSRRGSHWRAHWQPKETLPARTMR